MGISIQVRTKSRIRTQRNNRILRRIGFGKMIVTLPIVLVLCFFAALCIGQYRVPITQTASILISKLVPLPKTWTDTMYKVVVFNRLPRILAAILVGAALALAGSAFQGVFRNPLVSPDLLGVSNGACVGAAVSILLDLGTIGNVLFSFVGGLFAVTIAVMLPMLLRKKSTISLVLSGIIVSGFFTSILGVLKYVADADSELAEIVYWQMGSFSKVQPAMILSVAPIIILASGIILALRWRINVISLGDTEAKTLGINLVVERSIVVACASLLTAASICISGTIGWIGLVMPHLARMLVGQDNRKVFPIAMLLSAIFMIVVDTIARNLMGAEIPISIITGFVGTPFFAYVLFKRRKEI